MQSKTSLYINLAVIAVVGLAWLAEQVAWYIALPLMVAFLWRVLTSSPKATGSVPGGELPATFKFTYIDRDGVGSKRTVDVNGISQKDGATYLEGFCHSRGEGRTFRTDRILGSLTNVGTGEVIDADDLLLSVRERTSMDFKLGAKNLNKFNKENS